jgi:membrane-bound lytic murein transglycosylase D
LYHKHIFAFSFLLFSVLAYGNGGKSLAEERTDYLIESVDSIMRVRLSKLDTTIMEYRLDKAVRRRILNYVEHWPVASGRLLARSARFFPIFEQQLAAAGMPLGLKYVTVQESALRPWATSEVGAGGLWQLMPGTARELGLTVNGVLDERLDPELGCSAGLEYLRLMYERYGDWSLALAAYNCGPGNVNKAIRRTKGKNYWQIRRELPKQTRDYLPNIIAAAYVMTFHHEHDLVPGLMDLDMQVTEGITIHRKLSLYRVSQITGLRPEVVIELNAQYLRGYLPGLPGGHRLRLPKRVMRGFREYLSKHPGSEAEEDFFPPWSSPRLHNGELNTDRYYGQYSTVAGHQDTTLRQLADIYAVPVDQLAVWSNRGEFDSLSAGDRFFFYRVDVHRPYDPRVRNAPPAIAHIANMPAAPIGIPDRHRTMEALSVASPLPPKKKVGVLDRLKGWFE